MAVAVAVGPAVWPDPDGGAAFVDEWPVNPPMTSTATNAAACANNGAASFLRSRMTTGGIPSSPGSGATSLSRTYRSCSHHGRTGGLRWTTVGAVAGLYGVAAAAAERVRGVWRVRGVSRVRGAPRRRGRGAGRGDVLPPFLGSWRAGRRGPGRVRRLRPRWHRLRRGIACAGHRQAVRRGHRLLRQPRPGPGVAEEQQHADQRDQHPGGAAVDRVPVVEAVQDRRDGDPDQADRVLPVVAGDGQPDEVAGDARPSRRGRSGR